MSKSLTALEKLKGQVQINYQSTFDFGSYEIDKSVIEKVVQKEKIIFQEYKKYSNSIYEVCKALYEVSLDLKQEGTFMAWYKHIGLNKDKVSELLKRYQIFIQFPDKKEWVTSLSNQAVKILTSSNVDLQQLYDVSDLELKSVEDIKCWLLSTISPTEPINNNVEIINATPDEIINKFKDLKLELKLIKNASNISQYKNNIKSLKRELEEIELFIKEKEELLANEDNLNLFEN